MTTPLPSTDGVRVAVRVRPFSQVSDKGERRLVETLTRTCILFLFLMIVIKRVFKLLVTDGILNFFELVKRVI